MFKASKERRVLALARPALQLAALHVVSIEPPLPVPSMLALADLVVGSFGAELAGATVAHMDLMRRADHECESVFRLGIDSNTYKGYAALQYKV